jgi:hypothetical protein
MLDIREGDARAVLATPGVEKPVTFDRNGVTLDG